MRQQNSILLLIFFIILCNPIALLAKSDSCESAFFEQAKTTTGCIKVNQVKRYYRLHLPKTHSNKPLPIIIALHGGGGNPDRFENYTQLSILSDSTEAFAVVYPKGIGKHWNDGRKNVNPKIDDSLFLNELIQQLTLNTVNPFDLNKIFLSGMSNGGLMTLRMACEHPDWLKGIAVVAATMTLQIKQNCETGKALASVFIFGTKDTSFLNNGQQVNPLKPKQIRGQHIGIEATVQHWQQLNHCSNKFKTEQLDSNKKDPTRISKRTYLGCRQPVSYYSVIEGGHRWPDEKSKNSFLFTKIFKVGLASHDISSAEEIWAFFKTINNRFSQKSENLKA